MEKFKEMRKSWVEYDYPDEIVLYYLRGDDVGDFKPEINIIVKHKTKTPHPKGVFGEDVKHEEFTVDVIIEPTPERLSQAIKNAWRKYAWFKLNQAEQNRVLKNIENEYVIDVADYKNCPLLLAIYPLWKRSE